MEQVFPFEIKRIRLSGEVFCFVDIPFSVGFVSSLPSLLLSSSSSFVLRMISTSTDSFLFVTPLFTGAGGIRW